MKQSVIFPNYGKTSKAISTIAILWPVKAIFEKRAATVEVDTLVSLVFKLAGVFRRSTALVHRKVSVGHTNRNVLVSHESQREIALMFRHLQDRFLTTKEKWGKDTGPCFTRFLSRFLGRGCDEALFSEKKRAFFSETGGGNSVNRGFGKDFYRKGNSVKRSGSFSEPPDSEN